MGALGTGTSECLALGTKPVVSFYLRELLGKIPGAGDLQEAVSAVPQIAGAWGHQSSFIISHKVLKFGVRIVCTFYIRVSQ